MTILKDYRTEIITLNIGPQHPSTHGVLRLEVDLDGEKIIDVRPVVGYLHRGIEKICESKRYTEIIPLIDRLDYLAPISNELCYLLAVEKLMEIEVSKRAQYLRIILVELGRIASHLIWLGTHAMDMGAITVFLYTFRERELEYDLIEELSGLRMNNNLLRLGGFPKDPGAEFFVKVKKYCLRITEKMKEYEGLLTNNPIWKSRTIGIGTISRDDVLSYCLTGPAMRASGVDWDWRRDRPYGGYEDFKFNVPVRHEGDVYARYLVRLEEMRQSVRIIDSAVEGLPSGSVRNDSWKIMSPPVEVLQNSSEAMAHHFRRNIMGLNPPVGEVYQTIEAPRGELGVYIRSDGKGKPYRLKVRNPSLINLAALPVMARGGMIADLMAIIGSIDVVMGEVDK